eukprot:scaffold3863_cov59-Phaeocystis_antarctica.AAC.3
MLRGQSRTIPAGGSSKLASSASSPSASLACSASSSPSTVTGPSSHAPPPVSSPGSARQYRAQSKPATAVPPWPKRTVGRSAGPIASTMHRCTADPC